MTNATDETAPTALATPVGEEPRSTTYIEGYGFVDSETGELVEVSVELLSVVGVKASEEEAPREFEESDVEWALSKLFKIDGEIVASESRLKAEVEAITKNWRPQVNRFKAAKEGFLNWVKPQLQRYAERVLAVKNTKADGTLRANPERSVKLPKGTLAFRAINQVGIAAPEGGARDVDRAVEWLKENYPHALRSVWALDLDKLNADDREEIRAVAAGEKTFEEVKWTEPCPLKVTLPGERFDVRTGVK